MIFSSLTFLFGYLPIVLFIYFLVPIKYRNLVLLIVSLFFYGWGEPIYISIMILSIVVNWIFGNFIGKYRDRKREKAKKILILCIVFNLLLLGFFKYWNFFATNISLIGLGFIKPIKIGLPIGISFYTFQTMSYPIDLYRHDTDPQKSLISFGAYVTMFPQLIAGPIVRYSDIAAQLNKRTITNKKFYEGITRFVCGLAKKVLLANNIGQVYEKISILQQNQQSFFTAWIGIIAFALQIYFDFSGYSDMAIGLGKLLGFDFLENFNYPYIAESVSDFWRRWHMSLSFWFRDYVYIPLGGNRCKPSRQLFNIIVVWLLTGFWHGAEWNFILWGVFYGAVLIIEKRFLSMHLKKIPSSLRHIYTLLIVCIAWVFFAFTNLTEGIQYLSYMFGANGQLANGYTIFFLRDNLLLLIACIIGCTPLPKQIFNRFNQTRFAAFMPVIIILVMFICTAFIVDATYNPFLYFRF